MKKKPDDTIRDIKKIICQVENQVPLDFIYGINPEGLSEFERQLYDQQKGDRLNIQSNGLPPHLFFEHLTPLFHRFINNGQVKPFKLNVIDIITPENAEIIKAMANLNKSGCDCGCGCS